MALDDGEDDDAPIGPPPDPSLRQWRHPSEIASANAAAQRDRSPGQPARWRSLSFLGGCAIGLIGVVILGTAVVRPFAATQADGDDAALLATSTPSPSGALDSSGSTTDDNTSEPDSTDDTQPGSTSTTVITQVLVPTTLPATIEEGASGVIGILDASDRSLIATGLVLDGMVISSAYALGDRTDVLLSTGDDELEGLVVGIDPFTDLAVIATLEPDRLPAPIQIEESVEPTGLDAGSSIWILSAGGQLTPNALAGELASIDRDVMTSGGSMVFDALQTTVRTPSTGAGGALVDQDGHTVGMVIACDLHLASAVSIETLRASAQSIRETGWAHVGWLGIEGEGTPEGIRLHSVEPSGPAEAAGLMAGDLLLSVDGQPLEHVSGIVRAIRQAGVGNKVEFSVQRGDETFAAELTVGARLS